MSIFACSLTNAICYKFFKLVRLAPRILAPPQCLAIPVRTWDRRGSTFSTLLLKFFRDRAFHTKLLFNPHLSRIKTSPLLARSSNKYRHSNKCCVHTRSCDLQLASTGKGHISPRSWLFPLENRPQYPRLTTLSVKCLVPTLRRHACYKALSSLFLPFLLRLVKDLRSPSDGFRLRRCTKSLTIPCTPLPFHPPPGSLRFYSCRIVLSRGVPT